MKRVLGAIALLLVVAAAVLWFTPSGDYILLPDTAKPVGPLVTVAGKHRVEKDEGAIYFLAVIVRKASLFERFFPSIRSGATLVPASEIRPPGVSEKRQQRIERREMTQSQDVAAVVALRALGYNVPLARGVRVVSVIRGMPAAGKLRQGDLITAVDGAPVHSTCGLRGLFARRGPGKVVMVTIRRGERPSTARVRLASDTHERGRPVIGVIVQDESVPTRLPVRVKINLGSVVGPSAGLPFALEIMEKLGRDVDRGYRIAATGELEPDGCVLPIGGAKQKTIEARRSHVDILLVPAGDNAAVARRYADGLRVMPVHSFQQALRKLATVRPNH